MAVRLHISPSKMKFLRQTRSYLSRPPKDSKPLLRQFYDSSSPSKIQNLPNSKVPLTQQELTKINILIPRLCVSGDLSTAIHLTATSLLTNPPQNSISFSILIHSLTSQPDMSKSMSLLTILRHTTESHPHLTPITTMLITSYIRNKRPKEAFKVYQWMLRPGSPCRVDKIVYEVLVNGFCEFGLNFEALRILKDMVVVGFIPGGGLRRRVYKTLLREARVKEAMELDQALGAFCDDASAQSVEKLVELLDSIVRNWTE